MFSYNCANSFNGITISLDGNEQVLKCDTLGIFGYQLTYVLFTATSQQIEISLRNSKTYLLLLDDVSIRASGNVICPECRSRFLLNSETGQCDPCDDPNCLDCSETPCKQCAPTFELDSESQLCMCPDGTFENKETGECQECSDPHCARCTETACIECISNLEINPISQLCGCSDGAFLDSCRECKECYDPRCWSCDQTSCIQCAPGFIKNLYGECVCRKGFFLNEGGECQACQDPNCLNCDSSECLSCSNGYFLKGGVCLDGSEILDSYCSFLIEKHCKCQDGEIYGDKKCQKSVSLCDELYKDGECFHCMNNQLGRAMCKQSRLINY